MMKSVYRMGLALLFAAALLPASARSQQPGVVTGRVLERGTLKPIPDATVIVVGSGIAARTNQDGVYRLSAVAQGPLILRATRIGYAAASQTVTVGAAGNDAVDFQLSQVATQLDVVVTSAVTGQAERAREVGTNVGTIAVAQINKADINRFGDLLQGRTAGVSLQQTSGTTGTGQRLNIRGANSLSLSNEPLVYVDGMQVSNGNNLGFGVGGQAISRLNDISPESIEKVEVLKGPAATAVYGTSAANGVLLITTKRGHSGASRWNVYDETGTQNDITNYPANYLRYLALKPNSAVYTPAGAFDKTARAACFNFQLAAATCTADSVAIENTLLDPRTRPLTLGHLGKMGASVAGGNDQTQYYFNVDDNTEHGVVFFNTLQTLSTRANVNTHLLSNLDFSLSSQYNRSKLALNSNDNSVFSPLINGYVGSAFFTPPNPDGTPSELNYRGFNVTDLAEAVSHQNIDRFNIGGVANYRPFSWLSGNANLGMDYFSQFDFETVQPNKAVGIIANSLAIGERDSNHQNTYLWTGTGSATASWDPTASLHTALTGGGNYNRSLTQGTNGSGNGIVAGTSNLGATSSLFVVGEQFSEIKSIGLFSRLELSWQDRLFLSGSLRRDNNSAFGVNFGFITYPGINASWVMSDEPWFPKSDIISNVRLRSAYGQSGTRPNFRDAVTSFNPVSVSVNNVELSGVTINRTGNLSLRPELSKETEFGGDISFLKDRVSLQLTAFNKRSQDALISVPLAPSFGLTGSTAAGTTILRNLGALRNKGTETQLDLKVFDNDNMGLNIRGTATTLRNTILVIGQDATGKDLPDIVINRGLQRHRKGQSAGAFFQRPVFFNDANGDGLLSRSEVTLGDTAVHLGDAIPHWNRSIGGDLKIFKYVTVSTLFEGRGGNKTANASEQFRCASGVSFADRGCSATGNPNASLKEQAAFIASQFGGASATGGPTIAGTSLAGYVENGGFTKWRELAITLQAPDTWSFLRMGGARGASVTFAGRNLKTWTKYTGVDPEIIEAATSSFNQSEFNTQPIPRIYTLRFNLTF
jgi:TonB-dependent starch-binding outer membrane protein SusC